MYFTFLVLIQKNPYPGVRLRLHQTQVAFAVAFAFDFPKRNPELLWTNLWIHMVPLYKKSHQSQTQPKRKTQVAFAVAFDFSKRKPGYDYFR